MKTWNWIFNAMMIIACIGIWLKKDSFFSGYLAAFLIFLLVAYGLKKKLICPQIGKASHWRQMHERIGVFSLPVILLHLEFELPVTAIGHSLLILYLFLVSTGWMIHSVAKTMPKQLTSRGGNFSFETLEILIERKIADRNLRQEDSLFQYKTQRRWRMLLMVHETVSVVMLIVIVLHILLAYGFIY